MANRARRLYGVQFHPEVVHTHAGKNILRNFVFGICGAKPDWDVSQRVPAIEEQIQRIAGDRNVFFFVSGGVDSTVAYTLCLRALGPGRVYGVYVDTGLMREGETEFVKTHVRASRRDARSAWSTPRSNSHAAGRCTIRSRSGAPSGKQFVACRNGLSNGGHFLDGHWILGQGTIYPDTIESGGTQKADLIKTHHNRVPGIQKLLHRRTASSSRWRHFYKDEVREIGRELGFAAGIWSVIRSRDRDWPSAASVRNLTRRVRRVDEG